ncbi:MAG: succinate dehydrogenase, partial [Bacteroidales bacterium]|nr:succinate dehydrogenase [Bacteroidales bacterium]
MNEKIFKLSSITKKLLLALFGTFLLVFLLFHMCANLFILAKDGGDAYSAFCHFMGTNIFVRAAEIVLLVTFLLHIVLSLVLW